MLGRRSQSVRYQSPVFIDLADVHVSPRADEKKVSILRPVGIDDLAGVKALLKNHEIILVDMCQYKGDMVIAGNLLGDCANDCGGRFLKINGYTFMVVPFDVGVTGGE